jgi:hypothetical protein
MQAGNGRPGCGHYQGGWPRELSGIAVYYQTSAPAWSRLSGVAAIFEYDVDSQGGSRSQLREW